MSSLNFNERRKISNLLNKGGYVLDFTNASYGEFILEKTGSDLYSKYPLSKGKNLEEIVKNENDILVGKLLIELLQYMREIGQVNKDNMELFEECAKIGNKLIGRKTLSNPQFERTGHIISTFDFSKSLTELIELSNLEISPQKKGFEFEKYIHRLLKACGLEPRSSYKLEGEQIDGSFVLRNNIVVLYETKWTSQKISKDELVVFKAKVTTKSSQTRGLFISLSGYSDEALATFGKGSQIPIVLMTVQELSISFQEKMPLEELIWRKVRALDEEGDYFKTIHEM